MKDSTFCDYINRARNLGIIPNFWLTKEYLKIQDTRTVTTDKAIWIEEGEWAVFPPLPLHGPLGDISPGLPAGLKIWSDFANYSIGEHKMFLDWEYLYNPQDFQEMKGSQWAVFRKNTRKWPRGRAWGYSLTPPPDDEISQLLIKWLDSKGDELIEDYESMEWFAFKGFRRGFIYEKDKLVGINVWDANYPYVMYRYCITDPDEPFLNEFARLLFYRGIMAKMVIDGGTLGNPNLERFKDKLNPVAKRKVYSSFIRKRDINEE